MAAKTATTRRVGRPPAGARAGERVKDYPQIALRIPAEAKAKLHALSVVSARPQWRLLSDAIECYLRERPEIERRLVDALIARARKLPARTGPSKRVRK
jgi:hypothetical protein